MKSGEAKNVILRVESYGVGRTFGTCTREP